MSEPIAVPGAEYLPAEKLTDSVIAKIVGGLMNPSPQLARTMAREIRKLRADSDSV